MTTAMNPLAWRGLHLMDSGAAGLPGLRRLVDEVLAPRHANVLVYEIDYNFRFASHPELAGPDAWSGSQAKELADACAAAKIRLIPMINCLGHQSWKEPPGALLKAHPEFEEPPGGTAPQAKLGAKEFYCRSWCPRHPQVNSFVGDLVDELLDAFRGDAFHAGMDEVYVIASEACPRCRGADPAVLYAEAVNALHGRIAARGASMLMWGDRLLDGKATGYGDWEGATNGTDRAIDLIPKDIVVCDWHYEPLQAYPSLEILPGKGFRTWPTVWRNLEGARKFMAAASGRGDPKVLGVLTTVWFPAARLLGALFGGDDTDHGVSPSGENPAAAASAAARTMQTALEEAWTPPA